MSIDNIEDITPRVQYTASASQTEFDYPFPIFDEADVVVDVDGVVQTLSSDYTVSGVGADTGGTITLTSALSGGEIVTLYRDTAIERTSDFGQNGPFSSSAHNDELDRITVILQELKAQIGRAIRFPFNAATTNAQALLSPLDNWLGKLVRISSAGVPEPVTIADFNGELLTQSLIGDTLIPLDEYEDAAGLTDSDIVASQWPVGDVRRYGAVDDSDADSLVAFQRLDTYLDYRASQGLASVAYIIGDFVVSEAVTFSAQQVTYYFAGMVSADDSFTLNDFLLTFSGARCMVHAPVLNCNKRAAGINLTSGMIKVLSPRIDNYEAYGIAFNGNADCFAYDVHLTQIGNTDPDFSNDANFDAVGIYFNTNDCGVQGGITRWCGKNIVFSADSGTCWVRDVHPYNGRPSGTGRVDPVNIEVEEGAGGCVVRNCYVDHGLVKLFSHSVTIEGCEWLAGGVNATFTNQALIEVYPNSASDAAAGELNINVDTPVNLGSGYQMVKYLDDGSNTWAGDYSAVSASTREWLIAHNGRVEVFHRNSNDKPYHHVYKPGGTLEQRHEVGGSGTPHITQWIGSGTESHTQGRLAVDTLFRLPGYTVAELTAGISGEAVRDMAYCTDETGGAVPVFFDGTNWRRMTDRNIVST